MGSEPRHCSIGLRTPAPVSPACHDHPGCLSFAAQPNLPAPLASAATQVVQDAGLAAALLPACHPVMSGTKLGSCTNDRCGMGALCRSHDCVAAALSLTLSHDCAQYVARRFHVRVRAVVHGMEMQSQRTRALLHKHYHRSPAPDRPARRDSNSDALPSRPDRTLSHRMHNFVNYVRYLPAHGFHKHLRASQRETSWATRLSSLQAVGDGSHDNCKSGVTMVRPRG